MATLHLTNAKESRSMDEQERKEIRASAVAEFAERLKGYYKRIKGNTYGALVAYHVEQVAREMLEKENDNRESKENAR